MEPIECVIAAVVAILLAIIAVSIGMKVPGNAACLKAGYPTYTFDFKLNGYCVKRLDQTDVVVPIDEAVRSNP